VCLQLPEVPQQLSWTYVPAPVFRFQGHVANGGLRIRVRRAGQRLDRLHGRPGCRGAHLESRSQRNLRAPILAYTANCSWTRVLASAPPSAALISIITDGMAVLYRTCLESQSPPLSRKRLLMALNDNRPAKVWLNCPTKGRITMPSISFLVSGYRPSATWSRLSTVC